MPRPPAGLRTRIVALGATATIDVGHPRWAVRVHELLAPFVAPAAAPSGGALRLAVLEGDRAGEAVLVRDGAELAQGPWTEIEARLLVELNAAAIAAYDGLAVHAGVVARDGEAICFPGESGLGKSTMTAAALGAGFDYVSDEALCLDRLTATVVPYPRPISLSPASVRLLGLDATGAEGRHGGHDRELVVLPAALGSQAVATDRRLRLAHVVELRRGATELHLEPLHRAHAVALLLSMAFNHFKEPAASVDVVGAVARDVRVWRLHHDDPVEAATLLARTLG